MLAPTLKRPSDLLNKLLREQHRAFHAEHPSHVADHLYNFCVTALALRDHVFEFCSLDSAARREFNDVWAENPAWVACREIANTMKHSVLRYPAKTRAAIQTTSQIISVYQGADGKLVVRPETRPTIFVLLSDHTTLDVAELTQTVIGFWREYFSQHSLVHAVQPEAEFFGSPPSNAEFFGSSPSEGANPPEPDSTASATTRT